MDARRVEEICARVQSLRFFQQMPRHLVSRFVGGMVLRTARAESMLHAAGAHGSATAREEEHEFAVILRGSVAVYADSTAAQQLGRGGATAPVPAVAPAVPTHGAEGAPDDLDMPASASPSLPLGVQAGSSAATAAAAAAAAAAGVRKRGPRSLATAASGSISIPSSPWSPSPAGSVNASRLGSRVGSVSGSTTGLHGVGAGAGALSPPPLQQRGISLVPGWVTPPTSDDDDKGGSDNNNDDGSHSARANEESRRASALAATERARSDALLRRLESEAAERDALAAEERSLRLAEEAHANRVLECVTTLGEGDCFGLLGVLERAPRTATMVALDDTELAVLTRSSYERIMRELNSEPQKALGSATSAAPSQMQQAQTQPLRPRCPIPSLAKYLRLLRMASEQRSDVHLSYLYRPLLAHSRMLQQLDPRSLLLFASGMKYLHVPRAGVILQRQGEEAQWIFVVVQGSISEHYKTSSSSGDAHTSASGTAAGGGGGGAGADESSFSDAFGATTRLDDMGAEDEGSAGGALSHRTSPSRHGHGHARSPGRRQVSPSPASHSSPRRNGGAASAGASSAFSFASASASNAAGLSTAAAPALPSSGFGSSSSISGGSGGGGVVGGIDVLSSFGPCARMLLTGDVSLFPGRDVLAPSFWSRTPATLLSREPCVLAKISVDYLSHVLLALNRPMRAPLAPLRDALQLAPQGRQEAHIDALDALLKNVTMFQFKPAKLRRELCAKLKLVVLGAGGSGSGSGSSGSSGGEHVVFAQGEASDAFYILLSGSVSIHQKTMEPSGSAATRVAWDATGPLGRLLPPYGFSLAKTFGPCLSVLRAGSHFGEQALLTALPRNMTVVTRGSPVLLAAVTRRDYNSVFVPVQDEMSFHASKALQLLSRPGPRTGATVAALVDVLKHVSYFADMPVPLRAFAARHMEHETVEADTVLFEEDDPADYMYIVMEGSVGVHILDKKQKEMAQAAREENRTDEEAAAEAARIAALESGATVQEAPSIAEQMAAASIDDVEEPPPPTEAELLAAQMARDAEAEVARLRALKDEGRKKRRARRAAAAAAGGRMGGGRHQRDVSTTSLSGLDEAEEEDETETSSSSDSDGDSRAGGGGGSSKSLNLVPIATAGRMLASARGDVFTASGAGQYALQQRLRSHSGIGSALAGVGLGSGAAGGGGDAAIAELKKREQSEVFRNKMKALQERAAKEAAAEAAVAGPGTGTTSPDGSSAAAAGEAGFSRPASASRAASVSGSPAPGSSVAASAAATTRLVERVQVGHLSAAERTERYGPCVVQLPPGSVVGEVALTSNSNQRMKRTASIVTMEPAFFIKLRAEVVSRVTFGRGAAAGGSAAAGGNGSGGSGGAQGSGGGGPGSAPTMMTQDTIAAFLKTLDVLQIVKGRGSATGAGTGSHATFKRLAYHMKDRRLAAGFKLQEQGGRSDSVYFIVEGQVRMGRRLLVSGVRAASGYVSAAAAAQATQALVGKDKVLIREQVVGEGFQRVDTTYLPQVTGPEQPGANAAAATAAAASAAGAASTATTAGAQGSDAGATGSATGAAGDSLSPSASAPSGVDVPAGLPPLPQGLPLHVDLTLLGPGEAIGGLEALRGDPHQNEFVVASSSALVLQIKRNHFTNLFPQRALEQVRLMGEQREQVNARRVVKFVALRCGHMNLNPIAAALQHMAGSAGALHRPQHEQQSDSDSGGGGGGEGGYDSEGNEIRHNRRSKPARQRPPHEPALPLPPALSGLTGIAAVQAAKDPLKRKGLHALMIRPQTSSSGAALMCAALATAPPSSSSRGAARRRNQEGLDLEELAEMQAAEEHGLSPREAAAHAASSSSAAALLAQRSASLEQQHKEAEEGTSSRRREHVLSPAVVRKPALQSASMMHAMALVEARGAPPLTPVQRALGYTSEPRPPQPAFTWTNTPKGSPLMPATPTTATSSEQQQQQQSRPGAPGGMGMGSSASTGALFSTPTFGLRGPPLRPSTSQGLRDAQMQSAPTSPLMRPLATGSADSSRRTTGTRASADRDALSVLLSPAAAPQALGRDADADADASASSDALPSPSHPPHLSLSTSSTGSAGSASASASSPVPGSTPPSDPASGFSGSVLDAEQNAAVAATAAAADQRARRRAQSSGSITLKPPSAGLGPGVQYELLPSSGPPTALELRALSESLTEVRGGIIGLDGMPTLPTLQLQAMTLAQAEDGSAQASASATSRGSLSAPASRPVSARQRNKLAPLTVHAGPPGTMVSEQQQQQQPLQSQSQVQSPAPDSASSAAAAAFFSTNPASGMTVAPAPTTIPPAPYSSRDVLSMDLTSRALVLMRAEKAQIKWEGDEERRRGHRMLEKVKATSYNVPQDVKQAQLAVSMSWDRVDASPDPMAQSNAFIHSASPPLAVMNQALEGTGPGSPKRRAHRGPSISIPPEPQPPMPTELDPALQEQTVAALLARTAALSEANYAATRAARTEGSTRSLFAPRRRDDSNLATASSGIIRTLLTPLVDPGFTSLFAVGAGGSGSGSLDNTARTNRSEGAALFNISSRSGPMGRSASSSGKAFRPATAGELGRSASQRSLRAQSSNSHSHSSSKLVRNVVDRLSTPSARSMRPSSSTSSLGAARDVDAETKYPFVRFAVPVDPPLHDTLPHPDQGLNVAPVGPANRNDAWGHGSTAAGGSAHASPMTSLPPPKTPHRVSSAGMQRSPSSSAIVARIPQAHHVAASKPAVAAPAPSAAEASASSSALDGWQTDEGDGQSSLADSFDPRAQFVTPKARGKRASLSPSPSASSLHPPPAAATTSQQQTPASLASPGSDASPHPATPVSPLLVPMRHTRTSSLGSFMALANAGVERRPSVSRLLSPKAAGGGAAGGAAAGHGGMARTVSISLAQVDEFAGDAEAAEQQQQERTQGSARSNRASHEESKEQSAPTHAPAARKASIALSPSSAAYSTPLGALSPVPSTAASTSPAPVGSPASAPSAAAAAALPDPDAYLVGATPSFRKMSFVDERLAALRTGARIVADAHQAVYSRSSLGGAQLPGARNAVGAAPGGGDLTRTEAEALRRKRLFGIGAPRVTGAAATDHPTAFATVLAQANSRPGKLLAPKAMTAASRVRHDERQAARAASSDERVGKIINDFKLVDERNPL